MKTPVAVFSILMVSGFFASSHDKRPHVVDAAPQLSDAALAAALWPANLEKSGTEADGVAAARADLDHSGREDYLIVAYSNFARGAVRIVRRQGSGEVVGGSRLPEMVGGTPRIELLDVDADGKPEIVVGFKQNRGEIAWVLRWTGSDAVVISPTVADAEGVPDSQLSEPEFVDLAGDGRLALFDNRDFGDELAPYYVLRNGTYVAGGKFAYLVQYERSRGEPVTIRDNFSVADSDHDFTLRVITGPGLQSETSARVELNDNALLTPTDFTRHERVITLPLRLAPKNVMKITQMGKPGSTIELVITTP